MVGQWFVGTLVAMAMFTPTTTVTIKSFFDENSASVSPRMIVVEHVPYGIAYPAGMASYASKAISDNLMTWFTNANETGGAMSEGAGGLMNPLRLLSRMNSIYDCSANRATLCNNMNSFFKACPVEAEVPVAWRDQSSLQTLFDTAALNMGGYMEYKVYNAASSTGFDVTYVPCKEGGPLIYAAMIAYLDSDDYAKDLLRTESAATAGAKSLDGGETQDIAAMKLTASEMATKLQTVLSADQATTNAIAANMVFGRVARAAASTSGEVDDRHAARTFAATMTEARRKAVADQAGQASMFVSFMTQAMNAFSFLFAATAPIIVLIAMVMGLAGFKIYGSWLLFGVWSQSWLPIASLISYYVESNFWRRLEDLRSAGKLSILGVEPLFDQLANVLYTGSTMMSAVPIITLSLISGSMVAMSSLAGKATGTDRDYEKEDRMSPDVDKAVNSGHAQQTQAKLGNAFISNGTVGARAGAMDISQTPSVKGGDQITSARTASRQIGLDLSQKQSELATASKQLQEVESQSYSHGEAFDESKALAQIRGQNAKVSNTDSKGDDQKAQSTTGNTISMKAGGQAGIGFSVPGVSVGLNAGAEASKSAGHVDGATQSRAEQEQKALEHMRSMHAQEQQQKRESWQKSHDQQVSQAKSKVNSLTASVDRLKSESISAAQRLERAQSMGAGFQASMGESVAAAYSKSNPGELRGAMEQSARMAVMNSGGSGADAEAAVAQINSNVEKLPGGWQNERAVLAGLSASANSGNDQVKMAAWGAAAAAASQTGHHQVAQAYRDYAADIGTNASHHKAIENEIGSARITSPGDIQGPAGKLNAPSLPGMDYQGSKDYLDNSRKEAAGRFDKRPSQTITKAPAKASPSHERPTK
jgi:conjugal transfer mating pair stabilization protein TraG